MGSLHMGLEEMSNGFTRMAKFYAQRARGGVGLIVTGGIGPRHLSRPFLMEGVSSLQRNCQIKIAVEMNPVINMHRISPVILVAN